MNLIKFFTKDGGVAGLEVNDDCLRLVLLEEQKKTPPKVSLAVEVLLEPAAVSAGQILNRTAFTAGLKKLLSQAGRRINYVIVSLPADQIYLKVFTFPPTLSKEKLDNSLKLITSFQLPKPVETVYYDWEKISGQADKSQASLALIDKDRVRTMIDCLAGCGLQAVAMEFHPMGVARALDPADDAPALFIDKGLSSTAFSIVQKGSVRFLRCLPNRYLKNETAGEADKIAAYYEIEAEKIGRLILRGAFTEAERKKFSLPAAYPKIVPLAPADKIAGQTDWLPALGAAWRGLIPRADDRLTSLMEIGTELAYEQKKALTFAGFMVKLTAVLTIFFVCAFAGTWLLSLKIRENFNNRIENYRSLPATAGTDELEARAASFNELVAKAAELARSEPLWTVLIKEVTGRVTPGIQINSLNIGGAGQPVSISGLAEGRDGLNRFKESLAASDLFSDVVTPNVTLPLSGRTTIPFTLTFNLRDPSALNRK